ncbi:hypothetical protein AALO_G00281870 [Alosa alosa]|uniref:Alkylated DNA repair protein AlkB homologue 8 N-terminal domain-containing protein n=1 Tax=Alosa alosa TaxID=278164 RepID=A0AAV6FPM9_9TELE|nr:hypothetical protein AALO_G00281870 [Alosa alosa]
MSSPLCLSADSVKRTLAAINTREGNRDNNLLLNASKTKEIVVDFRRGHTQHLPLTIDGAVVERASSTKFWGCTSVKTSWTTNTASLAKRAQRRLYFLRKTQASKCSTSHHDHILPRHH